MSNAKFMNKVLLLSILCMNSLFFLTENIVAQQLVNVKGNGHTITKEITISEYTQIKIGGNINDKNGNLSATRKDPQFNYSQTTGSSSFKITTDENILSHLDIRVSGNCLIIDTKNNERLLPTQLEIDSSSPKLEKANISGTFQFDLRTELNIDKLDITVDGIANVHYNKPVRIKDICKIQIAGAAKMDVKDMTCQNINAEVSGTGDLKLKGKAQTGKYNATGVGNLKAYDFILENLRCNASARAHIQAHVTEILKAKATGAGEIQYKGFPRTDVHMTGAGKIKKIK